MKILVFLLLLFILISPIYSITPRPTPPIATTEDLVIFNPHWIIGVSLLLASTFAFIILR